MPARPSPSHSSRASSPPRTRRTAPLLRLMPWPPPRRPLWPSAGGASSIAPCSPASRSAWCSLSRCSCWWWRARACGAAASCSATQPSTSSRPASTTRPAPPRRRPSPTAASPACGAAAASCGRRGSSWCRGPASLPWPCCWRPAASASGSSSLPRSRSGSPTACSWERACCFALAGARRTTPPREPRPPRPEKQQPRQGLRRAHQRQSLPRPLPPPLPTCRASCSPRRSGRWGGSTRRWPGPWCRAAASGKRGASPRTST
mmetsp:Transcript_23357/g.88615  ORF Transcript_23357/g.88615 Transcript_23357/m.88615 type:complete len:261 (+) Transcript_23357:661-1443(+)